MLSLISVLPAITLGVVLFSWLAFRPVPEGVKGAESTPDTAEKKVRFSLATTRTYGTKEPPRVYISYQGVEALDFRVYQVRDPFLFFRQLEDPHQMGEDDYDGVSEVSTLIDRQPSVLELVRSYKRRIYYLIKSYIRSQLARRSRAAFNDRFMAGEQRPLLEADFARIPLLNPDQLVRSWRQLLAPTADEYDTRMISIGRREPGVYLVEAVHGELRAYTIAVVTDLMVVSKSTPEGDLLIQAVDRVTGEPQKGVGLEVVRDGRPLAQGMTNGDGVLRTTIGPEPNLRETESESRVRPEDLDPAAATNPLRQRDYLILARQGASFAVSDLSAYQFRWNSTEGGPSESGEYSSYVYTERPVYRPGQKVYFKGILRRLTADGYQRLTAPTLTVLVSDNDNREIYRKELPLTERGTFFGEVEIPADAPLGAYHVSPRLGEVAVGSGYFEVAEYKKPEYKVTVATPRRFVGAGEKTSFTIGARYFFGEPVREAEVKYYIYRARYHHWFYETEEDGLGGSDEEEEESGLYGYGNDMVAEGEGRLNSEGQLEVPFEVPGLSESEPWDYTYRMTVQVTDAARREIGGEATFVGTRGRVVVDANPERYVYYQNDRARINVRAADYEGRPQVARVRLRFVEIRYEKVEKFEEGYRYVEHRPIRRELSTSEVTTNGQGEATAFFEVPIVGSILVETVVTDAGREIVSVGGFIYATDRNNRWAETAARDFGSIRLIPDKPSYQPGETARVLAVLPVENASLLVTTEMNRIMDVGHYRTAGRVALLEVPIRESYSPNVSLSVTCVRDGEMYENSRSLAVPAREKFLKLELIPDKRQYKPRESAEWTVIARNADGSPAGGVEVSLGLVDEAIYSIEPDRSGDIRRAFYGTRYNSVSTSFSGSFAFTGYSGKKLMKLAARQRSSPLADFKNEGQYDEPTIRSDFRDTAFWQPDVVTGADGRAIARMTLPDNLTTWRATARAVSADLRVGARIDRILSRKGLIMRLETPRFLTEGDVVTISGIVHNYLDSDKVAQVEIGVRGAELLDTPRRTLTISRQGEQRVDWRVRANRIGEVRFLATAKTDVESDGVELPLPAVPMGLKQTRAESVALTSPLVEEGYRLNLPDEASSEARSLRIEASPSIAGALFGALDYLTSYPYGCAEQTMSSFLGNIAVARALKEARRASLRPDNDLPLKVKRGLERLSRLQSEDGGWGWFEGSPTDPYMTAWVVDGLVLARQAGYQVDPNLIERARQRIRGLLDSGKSTNGKPLGTDALAYLAYAYAQSGISSTADLDAIFSRREGMQPAGRAQLALALHVRGDTARAAQVVDELSRLARQTDGEAHWESAAQSNFVDPQSDLDATSFALRALAKIAPRSPLLPKVARWLVANRRGGYYWESTRDTTQAILGLTDYLRVSGELTASYSFEVYLNGEQVLSRNVTAAEAAIGQPLVVERRGAGLTSTNQIRVVKRGNGTLFFTATLEYYTRREEITPRGSENLTLTREYQRLKVIEVNGRPQWSTEPLTGELRSGDLIVARLTLKGARSSYLMVEDPIPAGCEQVERVDGINLDYREGRWSDWYNQREFRDQRTVIFSDFFDGDAVFQYALRVQVPGEFRIGPARAQLMYQPGIESNSGSFRLNILDRQR
jgi:uncharacterized protein YfaS (alpha-2-macroglobulin family)